uniref:Importin subunit alpha n=1 Tax=Timema bartmani TaxID=61472 RepID=A0A7R9I246_9NEOP|nr:unnamed protein product [Timema bartmani]
MDSSIELIRDHGRKSGKQYRREQRENVLNHNRGTLGVLSFKETSPHEVKGLAEKLKHKGKLKHQDLADLKQALIQQEDNIEAFFGVDGALNGLVRELSVWSEHWELELKKLICTRDQAISVFSSFAWGEILIHKYLGGYLPHLTWTKGTNASHQIAAANCCCNLALGSDTYCRRVTKAAAPYLISHLESLNNLTVETCAWTIGNLACGDQKSWTILHAQGALHKPEERRTLATCTCNLLSREQESHWLIFLLSCYVECTYIFLDNYVTSQALKLLSQRINIDDTKPQLTSTTALIRIIGNLASEESGRSAMEIVSAYKSDPNVVMSLFEHTLMSPYSHVQKESLWLLGLILTWQDAAEHTEATDCPPSPFFSSGLLRPIQWRVEAVALRHELNHLFKAYCDVLGQGAQTVLSDTLAQSVACLAGFYSRHGQKCIIEYKKQELVISIGIAIVTNPWNQEIMGSLRRREFPPEQIYTILHVCRTLYRLSAFASQFPIPIWRQVWCLSTCIRASEASVSHNTEVSEVGHRAMFIAVSVGHLHCWLRDVQSTSDTLSCVTFFSYARTMFQ